MIQELGVDNTMSETFNLRQNVTMPMSDIYHARNRKRLNSFTCHTWKC